MTFADSQIVYRGFDTPEWGEYRLIVGGVDVTRFRGVWSQIGTYSEEDPYGPGAADFRFPQVSMLEAAPLGTPNVGLTGDLAWCNHDVDAELLQVRAGEIIRTVWKGLLDTPDVSDEGVTWHCGGEFMAALELAYVPGEVFPFIKDGGQLAHALAKTAQVHHGPNGGLETGVLINERGRSAGTALSCLDWVLTETQNDLGQQLTYLPNDNFKYVQQWRDTTTVHGTLWIDGDGVKADLSSPPIDNTFWGQGRNHDGGLWNNSKAPGLNQGPTHPYPGADISDPNADTEDARALRLRLRQTGFLQEGDDAVQAVKDLQDAARLPRTGIVNDRTWNVLFRITVTRPSLRWARVHPLYQDTRVTRWLYDAVGAIYGPNPGWTGKRRRDRFIDFGVASKKRSLRWLRQQYERDQETPNWTGFIDLTTDVAVGDVEHDDEIDGMSRLDIRAGMNLRLRNFGDIIVHVAGVQVTNPEDSSQPISVRLAVDTKARNMLELSQIIARNMEAKVRPNRQWKRDRRRTHANEQIGEWSAEIGGMLGYDVALQGGRWNKPIPIPAGQSGTLQAIDLSLRNSKCEFAVMLLTEKRSAADCRAWAGNPLAQGNKWWKRARAARAKRRGIILESWGTHRQPCGYSDGQKVDEDGATNDPVTGDFFETAGITYATSRTELDDGRYESGVLYLAIYPRQDCTLLGGRVLRVNLDPGMG